MGQAKNRKAEILALKAQAKKSTIIIMPLQDDKLYKGKKAGDYIRENSVPNAMIVGTCFHTVVGAPVKTLLFITTDVKDAEARKAVEQWWLLPENKGPKFAAWLPLNDMKEMTASGLDKYGQGIQGQSLSMLCHEAGVADMFKAGMKRMCEQDPSYVGMFNDLGNNFGDRIMAAA